MFELYRGRQVLCLEIIPFLLHQQHHSLKEKQKQLDLFKETVTRAGTTTALRSLDGSPWSRVHLNQRKLHFVGSSGKKAWERERGERRSVPGEGVILPTVSQPEIWPHAGVVTFDTELEETDTLHKLRLSEEQILWSRHIESCAGDMVRADRGNLWMRQRLSRKKKKKTVPPFFTRQNFNFLTAHFSF